MKILRATTKDGVTVYMADPNGKEEVHIEAFKAYVTALDTIIDFERAVDKQYEKP